MDHFDRMFEGGNPIRAAFLGADPVPVWEQPPPVLVPGPVVSKNEALDPFYNASRSVVHRARPMFNRFTGSSGVYSVVTNTDDGPDGIRQFARYTIGTGIGSGRGFHIVGNPESGNKSNDTVPVSPDEPIFLSIYGRLPVAIALRLTLQYNDGTVAVGSLTSTAPAGEPGWTRRMVGGYPPAGATGFQSYITAQGTLQTGTMIDVAGLMLLRGEEALAAIASPPPVFDGNTTEPGFENSWEGVPLLSTSIKRRLVEYP